ncbi:hypothetical protein [Amycolatopsis sp. cmx-8-4]|uniref:hypothetical protein n=1 Tax=Amycolatopsis sp. cmx-8-4 TaxID=2790947 RepID=UPI00397E83F4
MPGWLSSATSAGCHQLIQDATVRLITCAGDILAAIEEGDEVDVEPATALLAGEAGRR